MLLALDTSGPTLSVGLFRGGETLFEFGREIGRGHAELLRPTVENALESTGSHPRDLQRIAVCTGPGSFTGLRAGLAFARGLALATGACATGVGTMEVLAHRVENGGEPFVVVLDARRNEVFAQCFQEDGRPDGAPFRHRLDEPWPFGDRAVAGSGALLVASRTLPYDPVPRPAVIARLAAERDPERHPASPFYGRGADAKPQASAPVAT